MAVVLVFFDGKLADVIRLHRHSNDTTPDDLLHEIRTEYDTELVPLSITSTEPAQSDTTSTDYTTPSLLTHLSKKTNDISEFVERATSSYIAQTQMADHNLLDELLRVIQERYQLAHFPYKIECIDISHLSGSNISG